MTANVAHSDISRKPERRYFRDSESQPAIYTGRMKLRLKTLRKEKGLTQRQVAEAAGMSVSYYTEIELGKKQINARRLELIAKALGVQPHQLIEGSPTAPTGQIVTILETLSVDQQRIVLELVRSLAQKP